jgi:hypothetical protein
MPKTDIDYSNTIIYKITCKDETISDVYVGHTTNFVQRKHAHKQSCINPKAANYTVKLYEVIRANGGWNNWKMEIINFFECKDHYEARKKEQEYFISLNATLNSIEPLPKPKVIVPFIEKKEKDIFLCSTCNIQCSNSKLLEDHNKTNKHLKKIESIIVEETNPNNTNKFVCASCDFKCSKQSNYNLHLLTKKHKNLIQKQIVSNDKSTASASIFTCNTCKKIYKARNSLWYHEKKCTEMFNNNNIKINNTNFENVFLDIKCLIVEVMKSNSDLQKQHTELQKQHTELQKQLIDVCKNSSNTIINNSHNN